MRSSRTSSPARRRGSSSRARSAATCSSSRARARSSIPQFSGVTLGLYHGSAPHALVLVHRRRRHGDRGRPRAPDPAARRADRALRARSRCPSGRPRSPRSRSTRAPLDEAEARGRDRRDGGRNRASRRRSRPFRPDRLLDARPSRTFAVGYNGPDDTTHESTAWRTCSSTTRSRCSDGQVLRVDSLDVGRPARPRALPRGAPRRRAPVHERRPSTGSARCCSQRGLGRAARVPLADPVGGDRAARRARDHLVGDEHPLALARRPDAARAPTSRRSASSANRRWERISQGEMRWCGTLFPTNAHAQDAEMSLPSTRTSSSPPATCTRTDPAAHWRSVSTALAARARRARDACGSCGSSARTPTSASASRAARGSPPTAAQHARRRGLHEPGRDRDGGRDPLTRSPAVYHGREVEDVRLRFEGGRVVARRGGAGRRLPRSRSSTWTRARACSARSRSASTTRSTASPATSSSTRRSAARCTSRSARASRRRAARTPRALHWDMICDLREDGEVYADGELVWKAGRFLPSPRARWSRRRAWLAAVERLADVLVDYSTSVRAGRPRLHRATGPAAAPLVREVYRRVLDAGGASAHAARRRRRAGAAPARRLRRPARLGEPAAEGRGRAGRRAHRHRGRAGTPAGTHGVDPARQARSARAREPLRASTRAGAAPASCGPCHGSTRPTPRRRTPTCRSRSTRTSSTAPACSTATTPSPRGAALGDGSRGSPTGSDERREIRIVGDGTDLTHRRRGPHLDPLRRPARTSLTARSSPGRSRRASTATIRFSYPAAFRGPCASRAFELEFEGGEVVEADGGEGETSSSEMLALDDGARRRGRVRLRHERGHPGVHRATPSSTRRSAARSTWRSARRTRRAAARTSRRSTGTSSATCGRAARSSRTASSSTATAASSTASSDAPRRGARLPRERDRRDRTGVRSDRSATACELHVRRLARRPSLRCSAPSVREHRSSGSRRGRDGPRSGSRPGGAGTTRVPGRGDDAVGPRGRTGTASGSDRRRRVARSASDEPSLDGAESALAGRDGHLLWPAGTARLRSVTLLHCPDTGFLRLRRESAPSQRDAPERDLGDRARSPTRS